MVSKRSSLSKKGAVPASVGTRSICIRTNTKTLKHTNTTTASVLTSERNSTTLQPDATLDFIPARAIKVPLGRHLKQNEDFTKMKNLFLANCLKVKQGEHELNVRMEKAMSTRIKANRGDFETNNRGRKTV